VAAAAAKAARDVDGSDVLLVVRAAVAAAKEELETRGAECVGSGDTGVCKMAVFLDPDGNAVILHRRYKDYE